jgi:protein tyrosine phosphatase (PTP) superfamily phosphohydrolase (DUF442 family)
MIKVTQQVTVGELPSADHLSHLAELGFRSVLNLDSGEGEQSYRYLPASREREILDAFGMDYIRLPLSLASLEEKFETLCLELRRIPKPTFVHAGIGRETTALTAVHIAVALDAGGEYAPDPNLFDLLSEYDNPSLADFARRTIRDFRQRRDSRLLPSAGID